MPNILKQLVRARLRQDDSILSQNIDEAVSEVSREELDFEEGETPDIDIPDVNDIDVKQASKQNVGGLTPDVSFEFGQAESGSDQAWYTVEFDDEFKSVPIVIAVAKERETVFGSEEYTQPSHGSPSVDQDPQFLEGLPSSIEDSAKQVSRDTGAELWSEGADIFQETLPDAGFDIDGLFVDAWDEVMEAAFGAGSDPNPPGEAPIESVFGFFGREIGEAVQDSINNKASEVESVAGQADLGLGSLSDNANSSYGSLSDQAEHSLNNSQRKLYEGLGIPDGNAMTPIQVRNERPGSFQFLGYEGGMEINYLAIGERDESELEAIIQIIIDRVTN